MSTDYNEALEWVKRQHLNSILTYANSYELMADELFGCGTDFQDEVHGICVSISNYWFALEHR